MTAGRLERLFPKLLRGYIVLEPATRRYNCIAWAMGDTSRWWHPGSGYWPAAARRADTVAGVSDMLLSEGFEQADSSEPEPGVRKVTLYAKADRPTHMALQQPNGKWSSKLGDLELIEHDLDQLEGVVYAQVVAIYARRD